MCLTIWAGNVKSKQSAVRKFKKVATKDIVVYKVLKVEDGEIMTPYRNFPVSLGYHYYQTGRKFGYAYSYFGLYSGRNAIDYLYISKGLHSYTNLWRAKLYLTYGEFIVRAIIPKGSIYFESKESMVSDNLIITKKILVKERKRLQY